MVPQRHRYGAALCAAAGAAVMVAPGKCRGRSCNAESDDLKQVFFWGGEVMEVVGSCFFFFFFFSGGGMIG